MARTDDFQSDLKPGLAIISNVPRPDRVHAHIRLADEIPEVAIHSLFIRSGWQLPWSVEMPDRVHAVDLSVGEDPGEGRFGSPWKDWGKGGRIIEYLRKHNVQAVIFNGYSSLSAVRALLWCHRNGIPGFIRSDSNIAIDKPSGILFGAFKKRFVTWFVNRCFGVMPMGELGWKYYERYGARRDRTYWSPSIPDYAMFENIEPEARAAFMEKHGLDPGRKRILYCGRLAKVKRVDLLIDAFAHIANERPDWDLLIAGSGVLEEEHQARVPDTLRGRVTWLGFMQWEDLPPAYWSSDVFCLPSDYEPWAVVVIEAMAAGQVVVASDIVQAAHELYEDGQAGRLFESGSVEALTNALREVTDPTSFDGYQQRVAESLANWRRDRDPVQWTRKALEDAGVLVRQNT